MSINANLSRAAIAFSAGTLGGLANSVFLWLLGAAGVTLLLDVAIAPALTAAWLYPRLVWGGIWGLLFVLPRFARPWPLQGLLYSLGPSLVQLLIVFPVKTDKGMLGLGLGALTPLLVVAVNAVWGLVAAWAMVRLERDGTGR